MAGWHERRSCCQLTAAASQHASLHVPPLSPRRLSRLLAAACSQGSQPPSLGRVLPGAPNPGPRLLRGRLHGNMEGLVSVGPLPTQKPANTASDTYRHRHPHTPTYARDCSCPSSLTHVRRRPAGRRKPLNPGAGHAPVSLPEAFGW